MVSVCFSSFHFPNTVSQLARRRLPGGIHTRRAHVECATFLLSFRDVRFVFYFTVVAYLRAGKHILISNPLHWLNLFVFIRMQITGADIFDVLKDQILHFDVHKSTFDIVMSSICRFVVLLLFYALISMNHWCIIAVSVILISNEIHFIFILF